MKYLGGWMGEDVERHETVPLRPLCEPLCMLYQTFSKASRMASTECPDP